MENPKRSVKARFGGNCSWKFDDGRTLNLSEAICGEGPGDGFAMLPWVLDDYERVLRLQPGETWLLKRLLKHAWEFDGLAYPSQRKIARQANITRPTLRKYMRRLEELGYVLLASEGTRQDRRKRYDVSGIYAALALCIACDPNSKWAQNHGVLDSRKAASLGHSFNDRGIRHFDLDFDLLHELAERDGDHDSGFDG